MIQNEANELFSYLSKDSLVTPQTIRNLLQKLFIEEEIPKANNQKQKITKESLITIYKNAIGDGNVEERLFHLFYHLDQGKKGYLSAQDIQKLFSIFGKEVTVNDIQSSFRYAKLPHNRLSFQDFKDHFYRF